MAEEVLINVTPREIRVALLDDGITQEIHVERHAQQGLLGNIYKGRVSRLMPGIQAAFIDIGLERMGFLHLQDLHNTPARYAKPDKTTLNIDDYLHQGQDLLVQVYKDPLGSKGARLSTGISLPSRFMVFTPNNFQVAVSQKITDETERQRLISMVQPSEEGGYIFRTAAQGMTENDVTAEVAYLKQHWATISAAAKAAKTSDVVYEELPLVLRLLRDWLGYRAMRVRVDNEKSYAEMRRYASLYLPELVEHIEYYADARPIFDIHSVEEDLQRALQRKVYLKSGGYVVFDQTEAMTTVDVNTGSYLGKDNLEDTIFKTNLEAAQVIARQVRLRNLGGIIIIDFIDMLDAAHRDQLLQSFKETLAKDPVKTEMSELSSLGLLQMTRKRTRESLERTLCVTCPLCLQRGSIKSLETVSYDILREIRRVANYFSWSGYTVLAAKEVVEYMQTNEKDMLAALQIVLKQAIQLIVEPTFTQEQYDIIPMSEKE